MSACTVAIYMPIYTVCCCITPALPPFTSCHLVHGNRGSVTIAPFVLAMSLRRVWPSGLGREIQLIGVDGPCRLAHRKMFLPQSQQTRSALQRA